MNAETVFNVAMALPESELQRLIAMLEKDRKPAMSKKSKKSNVWTVAECTEAVLKVLNARKKRKREFAAKYHA